jgi:hypothetical protein
MFVSKIKIPGTTLGALVELDETGRTAAAEIQRSGSRYALATLSGPGFDELGRAKLTGKVGEAVVTLEVTKGASLTTGKLSVPIPELGAFAGQLGVALMFKRTDDSAGVLDVDQDGDVDRDDLKTYAKKHPLVTGIFGAVGLGVAYKIGKAIWGAI